MLHWGGLIVWNRCGCRSLVGAGDNPIHFCVTTKWLDLGHQFNHLATCVHFSRPHLTFWPVKLLEIYQMFTILACKMNICEWLNFVFQPQFNHFPTCVHFSSFLEIAVKSGCTLHNNTNLAIFNNEKCLLFCLFPLETELSDAFSILLTFNHQENGHHF